VRDGHGVLEAVVGVVEGATVMGMLVTIVKPCASVVVMFA
jgi:hypothetical protein